MTRRPGPLDLVVGRWGARFGARRMPASIGRGGLRRDKVEGDMATPVGVWRLTALYWRPDRSPPPRGPRPLRPIGPLTGWCEDPADPDYNRPIRMTPGRRGDRMRRGDPLYDFCAVTDHNAAGAPGAGSAIFLHLRRGPGRPTAGCVALRRDDLLWVLARWRPWSRLVVRDR